MNLWFMCQIGWSRLIDASRCLFEKNTSVAEGSENLSEKHLSHGVAKVREIMNPPLLRKADDRGNCNDSNIIKTPDYDHSTEKVKV